MQRNKSKQYLYINLSLAILINFISIHTAIAYTFDQQFKTLVEHTLPNVAVGLVIQDAKTGKTLYSSRAYEGFTPASTVKLFTTAAALEYLKPDYSFQTRLDFDKAQIHKKVLKDDLILTFTGDPTFTSHDLNKMFERLKNSGVHKLSRIVVDHSRFETPHYAPGWTIDDVQWSYGAPISAIIIDGNKSRKMAVKNPEQLANTRIREALSAAKINLQGGIQFSKRNIDYNHKNNKSIIHYSDDLDTIVKHTLVHSNNLAAESLLKTLGYYYYNKGNFQDGVLATHAILSPITGIDFSKMRVHDGSGISHYNCLSPDHLCRLLFSMYHHTELNTLFMDSLPISGKTGTLKKRLQAQDHQGFLLAKTGTLNGKSALAGYLKYHPKKFSTKTLIMVIMINQSVAPQADIKKLEDNIVNLILHHPEFG